MAGLGGGPGATPPRALSRALATLHRPPASSPRPAGDAGLREGLSPGRGRLRGGRSGRALFVVVEGAVEITRATAQGPDALNTLGPGDAFGELALIDDFPRSATARVATPGRLVILYKSDFDALIEGNARIALVVLRNLSRRLAIYVRRNPVLTTEPRPGEGRPAASRAGFLRGAASRLSPGWPVACVLPLFLAAALAYLLSPAVAWADALAIRRSVAVSALFAVIIAVLVVACFLLGLGLLAEGAALMDRLPALARQIDLGLDAVVRDLAESAPAVRRLLPEGGAWVQRFVLDRGLGEPAEPFGARGACLPARRSSSRSSPSSCCGTCTGSSPWS